MQSLLSPRGVFLFLLPALTQGLHAASLEDAKKRQLDELAHCASYDFVRAQLLEAAKKAGNAEAGAALPGAIDLFKKTLDLGVELSDRESFGALMAAASEDFGGSEARKAGAKQTMALMILKYGGRCGPAAEDPANRLKYWLAQP